jgi:hypothetical protein
MHAAFCLVGTSGFFSGLNLQRHEADQSPKVKNAWSYTSTSPHAFMMWCLIKDRANCTFSFLCVCILDNLKWLVLVQERPTWCILWPTWSPFMMQKNKQQWIQSCPCQLHGSLAPSYPRIVEHVAAACMARRVVCHSIRLGAHRSVLQVITVAIRVAVVY